MTEQDSGWRRDEAPQHDEQAGASLSPVSPGAQGASSSERPPSSSQPEEQQPSPYGSSDQPPSGLSWPPPAGSAPTGPGQPVPANSGYAAPAGAGFVAPGGPTSGAGYPTSASTGGAGYPPPGGSGYPTSATTGGAGYPPPGGYGTGAQPTVQQPANGNTTPSADPYEAWSRRAAAPAPVTGPPGGASQPAPGGPDSTGTHPTVSFAGGPPQPVSGPAGQPVSGTPGGYAAAGYPVGGAQPVSGPAGQPVSGAEGYPTSGYAGPGAPAQSGGYPTANYPAQGYPPAYTGNQPGPGGYPVGYHPGQTTAARGRSRGGLIALIIVVALLLTVGSGTIGAFIAHRSNAAGGTQVVRESVPDVSRDSVAGIAAKVLPSVVDITTDQGEGSGVIMTADGSIVTNNHVVEGATGNTVNVTFSSGKTAKATIVGTDPAGDVAVIKAQGVTGLTAAKFGDSDGMRVGDTVLAIGSPLGLQGSVSEGIISALHRTISEGSEDGQSATRSISDALQTDAAINPGNSGGALINLNGEVIGINTAIATSGQGSSSGNIGVGFAISSNRVKSAADQLSKGGKVSHPYLGVGLTDGQTGGALIANVVSGGPADKAGLQKGDVVMQADGQNVADSTALINAVQGHKVGDSLKLTIQRNGAQQQVTVTLGETPQ